MMSDYSIRNYNYYETFSFKCCMYGIHMTDWLIQYGYDKVLVLEGPSTYLNIDHVTKCENIIDASSL